MNTMERDLELLRQGLDLNDNTIYNGLISYTDYPSVNKEGTYKVYQSSTDKWYLKFDEIATFDNLDNIKKYVDNIVQNSEGKINKYSFTITQVEKRKWYERKLFSKKPLNKYYEHILTWEVIGF